MKEVDSLSDLGADQNNDVDLVAASEHPTAYCAVLFRSAFQGFAKPFNEQLTVPCVSSFLIFPVL